jgi:hypothetical protein
LLGAWPQVWRDDCYSFHTIDYFTDF